MELINFNAIKSALGIFGFLADFGFWKNFFAVLRQVLIILSIVFLIVSVLLLFKIWPMRLRLYVRKGLRAYRAPQKQVSFEEAQKLNVRRKWDEIIKKVETGGAASYGMAIIEADILVEDVMGRLGFLGKNLAERLSASAPGEIASANELWKAHKLRNKIAHEPGFRPSKEETVEALATYKKVLEELEAIKIEEPSIYRKAYEEPGAV